MKIESIGLALPARKVTNDDILSEIAERSTGFKGDLTQALRTVDIMLRHSGSSTRYWKDDTQNSLDLAVAAGRDALARLDGDDHGVDLILYASVYSELKEPSSSGPIAHELGMDAVETWDVKMACDGWMKAVKTAYALIETGLYRRIMVVTSEFSMAHNYAIYPKLFELDSIDQLEWRFPAYTIGEAASATILGPDPANGWAFFNRTRNDLYDLCTVPNPWSNPRSARVAKDGLSHFTSYGIDLRKHGFPDAVETFRESGIDTSKVDVLFTHSSSKADWSAGAKLLGMHNKMYDIYSKFGNVVSGAIPVAMASAEREGTLKRGMNVAAWVASAGMSFSTAEFVY